MRAAGPAAAAAAERLLPGPLFRALRGAARGSRAAVEQHLAPRLFGARVRHVAGPERIDYGPDEVLAISIVRDGEAHLASFLEHHLALGVRHLVLLDNGSVDRTVEIARGYDRVTVLRTDAPYGRYENVMKRYLARRFSRGRWNLMVDVDERFDYPFSDAVPLRSLLGYLNRHGYTAVVAHMLDRFPDGTLSELAATPEGRIEDAHPLFDTSAVRARGYRWGVPGHPGIREYKGGIRHAVFGIDCGLTKAPLVRVDDRVDLFVGWHHTRNARIADFDALLLHYPFVGFHGKVRDAVESSRYGEFSRFYAQYWERLQAEPGRRTATPAARRFRSAEALLEEGFLAASGRFVRWAEAHRAAAPAEGGS